MALCRYIGNIQVFFEHPKCVDFFFLRLIRLKKKKIKKKIKNIGAMA